MPAHGAPSGGFESYIKDLTSRVKSKYSIRNERIEKVRERRLGIHPISIPDEYNKITQVWHAPLVSHLLEEASSIMGNELPTPQVHPLRVGIESAQNSSKREHWLELAYHKLFSGGLYGRITDAQPADGYAVWQVTMRTQRWGEVQRGEDEEAESYNDRVDGVKRTHFPFVARFVSSKTFFKIEEDEDGITECLEITQREARPVAAEYKLQMSAEGKLSKLGGTTEGGYPPTCEFSEYWNRDRFVYSVDGEVVKQGKHLYGRVPYYYAPFRLTSIDDPAYETSGLCDQILDSHDKLESLVAMQSNWGTLSAFPIWVLDPISDDVIEDYDDEQEITWDLGGTVNPPRGYRWRAVTLPPVGEDLVRLQTFIMEIIERVSLAPILQGRLEAGISGPTASAQISLAKSLFGSALNNLGDEFSAMGGWLQEMIDKVLDTTVPVYDEEGAKWAELGPSDIKGYYEVTHSLQPIIHLERMQKAIMWADAQARGAVDMNYYREEGLGLANPEQHDKRVMVEQLRKSPQYMNTLMAHWQKVIDAQIAPTNVGGASPPSPPIQMGGPGVPQEAGVGQAMLPGVNPALAAMPPPNGLVPGGGPGGPGGPGPAGTPPGGGLPPFQTVQAGVEMPPPA